jgi:hypothetical protein
MEMGFFGKFVLEKTFNRNTQTDTLGDYFFYMCKHIGLAGAYLTSFKLHVTSSNLQAKVLVNKLQLTSYKQTFPNINNPVKNTCITSYKLQHT